MPAWAWVVGGCGAALRIVPYLHNRALWYDEAATSLVIITGVPAPALPMPGGFMWTVGRLTEAFGTHEYVLRLYPLLLGLAALALFYRLASTYLEPAAALLAFVLFAVSDRLIYYSSEVKQYSGDVAIAVLLLLVTRRALDGGLTAKRALAYAALGAIVVWFSHPAVFVLAGCGTTALAVAVRRKKWTDVRWLCVAGAVWAASFAASYTASRENVGWEGLQYFWSFAFPPLPMSPADVLWYPDTFIKVFRDSAGFVLPGLAAFAFFVGCASLARARPADGLLLLSPIPFVMAASALRLYPFADRLLLFLVPSALLVIAHGADRIRAGRSTAVAVVLIAMLAAPSVAVAAYRLVRPATRQEIKPVLAAMRDAWQDGDQLYVYYGAKPALEYYGSRYGFDQANWRTGVQSRENWQPYFDEIDRFRGTRRLWVLFSHVYDRGAVDEEQLLLFHLDRKGRRVTEVSAKGASAYLYDLSRPDG